MGVTSRSVGRPAYGSCSGTTRRGRLVLFWDKCPHNRVSGGPSHLSVSFPSLPVALQRASRLQSQSYPSTQSPFCPSSSRDTNCRKHFGRCSGRGLPTSETGVCGRLEDDPCGTCVALQEPCSPSERTEARVRLTGGGTG